MKKSTTVSNVIMRCLWRQRHRSPCRWGLKAYFNLLRCSTKWWLQFGSLALVGLCLLMITQNFLSAYLNHQQLKKTGDHKLAALEQALSEEALNDAAHLVEVQKALFEYIKEAKNKGSQRWLVSRFGVDAERSQICPYSKALLNSIEAGIIVPMAHDLEDSLTGYAAHWQQQDDVTRAVLYPGYAEKYACYHAMFEMNMTERLECLSTLWYQSIKSEHWDRHHISQGDLKHLLQYYFARRQVPLHFKADLVVEVAKQLSHNQAPTVKVPLS